MGVQLSGLHQPGQCPNAQVCTATAKLTLCLLIPGNLNFGDALKAAR